ncbi:3',5'-cyclic AMP phosphodiesterase CpdA [Anaerosolibacter carboniphilus]|uniref:3',5'-cyclic AMP phosphodiesterase CpdA n=1 Tax=Anaerosolibacter carboniphilus TaxID=1417629 RepID=A0A841KLW4_9FIRM|nr:metallophosphoesterase [Anaerosolibacter carboniphilus]MBB6214416.1 3',5'-cyclic AMP phosphodiesterase CpdA [Anaerosolibacter carboniphilus]
MRRKTKLLLAIAVVLILGSIGIFLRDQQTATRLKAGEEVTFFVASDIHYLADSLKDGGEAFKKYVALGDDGRELDYIDEIMRAFIYDIQRKKPEILLVSGDLTNNGEKASHLELKELFKEIEALGTSVYVIPGNHDILNPWATGFKEDQRYATETINDKDFKKIYEDFGYKDAIARDRTTLSYLAAPSEDLWLLMLDTNQYRNNMKDGRPEAGGVIGPKTLAWIKECSDLAKKKNAKIITVMHHNLLDHNEMIQEGYTLDNHKECLTVFEEQGLNIFLSGHIHIQDISSYKPAEGQGKSPIYDIVTSSLNVYPQQYGVLQYSPDREAYDYSTAWVDVEGWSKEAGIVDENINHFKDYSEKSFGKEAYYMAYLALVGLNHYTEEELDWMAKTMEILNIRYFAGKDHDGEEEIKESKGFELWKVAPNSFVKRYLMSILKDQDMEDNRLHMEIRE